MCCGSFIRVVLRLKFVFEVSKCLKELAGQLVEWAVGHFCFDQLVQRQHSYLNYS